jgi:hypothetical protein
LQRAQTLLGTGLTPHVGQELLERKEVTHQPFEGQGAQSLLLMKDVDAASDGIGVAS